MNVLATDVISLLILIIGLLAIINLSLYFWIRKNELDIEELRKAISDERVKVRSR